ncbi:MAG TPA: hypothetical protein V6D19_09805 [Stenomitos sp.]
MSQCPKCRKKLHRVHRKPIERIISYLIPVHRFICYNHACRWQGLRLASYKSHPLVVAYRKQRESSSTGT